MTEPEQMPRVAMPAKKKLFVVNIEEYDLGRFDNTQPHAMNNRSSLATTILAALLALAGPCPAADAPAEKGIFPDKNLEAAVRKQVFEKRDNNKPITETDVANLSTINGKGLDISDLTGLEKCKGLASLELAKNKITKLDALKGLASLQYLNLADNQVEDLAPLAGVPALQYIELSNNKVKSLGPLAGLTNLASLYFSNNQVSDIEPLLKLPRLTTLYLDGNQISSIKGIGTLTRLYSLSLSNNSISDLAPLDGLTGLYHLFLEKNKITDLAPLVAMLKKDNDGPRRFAPFINIYLAGNPLTGPGKSQISKLKDFGARVSN